MNQERKIPEVSKMPKPSNSVLDKMLGSFFLTAYAGIGLLAGVGVVTTVKNILQEDAAAEKKENDEN